MIKLICFDLWNTLATRKKNQLTSSVKELEDFFKIKEDHKTVVKAFESSIQTKNWSNEYEAYSKFLLHFKIKPTFSNVMKAIKIREDSEYNIILYDFVIPLLKQIKDLNIKIGLISNSSVFVIKNVRKKTDLLDYIDYPLFSFDVKTIKPDPKIYEEMLKIAKIKPEEMIMIG
ncbi:MAG: HAD family hydrolase, partial [Candidatus Cloacimonetes bacterium]|nr:HAD family hydrolase [Candidatus Cloacimonadota bacterium]